MIHIIANILSIQPGHNYDIIIPYITTNTGSEKTWEGDKYDQNIFKFKNYFNNKSIIK